MTVRRSIRWRGHAGSAWTGSPASAGLHPELVRRFVALGLLDATGRRRRALVPPGRSWSPSPGCSGCAPGSR